MAERPRVIEPRVYWSIESALEALRAADTLGMGWTLTNIVHVQRDGAEERQAYCWQLDIRDMPAVVVVGAE